MHKKKTHRGRDLGRTTKRGYALEPTDQSVAGTNILCAWQISSRYRRYSWSKEGQFQGQFFLRGSQLKTPVSRNSMT